jgi:S1-C subfamily serine protease
LHHGKGSQPKKASERSSRRTKRKTLKRLLRRATLLSAAPRGDQTRTRATSPTDNRAAGASQPTEPQASYQSFNSPAPAAASAPGASTNVTVCSGVSVGQRLVVTYAQVASPRSAAPQFRVTLPDGEQSSAELRVADLYSGLNLLELQKGDLPSLECATKSPKVGDTIMTASASGIEPPIISRGIVSGLERALSGTGLPPLLLCDVRTTETSSGAPLVNEEGQLVGVIIAAGATNQMANWAYAVPAQFVTRLMNAHKPGELVVLERRRATVGLTMGQGEEDGTVEVEHVTPQGPADRAGFRKGDRIVEAEGRKIRSAYQAVDMILSRQPGDQVEFVVEQNGEQKNLHVTLGGTFEPTSGPYGNSGGVYVPQVKVEKLSDNSVRVENGVELLQAAPAQQAAAATRNRTLGGLAGGDADVNVLREQIFRCEKSISELQAEVNDRERKLADNEKQIKLLRAELSELRRKVTEPAKRVTEAASSSADSK